MPGVDCDLDALKDIIYKYNLSAKDALNVLHKTTGLNGFLGASLFLLALDYQCTKEAVGISEIVSSFY